MSKSKRVEKSKESKSKISRKSKKKSKNEKRYVLIFMLSYFRTFASCCGFYEN
jgi:hypothetical protein